MNFLRSKRVTSEVVRRKPAHAQCLATMSSSETDSPIKRTDNEDASKVHYYSYRYSFRVCIL